MKQPNKITPDDIKRVASLSDSEMKRKLNEISSSLSSSAVGKMLSDVNLDSLKNQIQTKNPDDLAKFINKLGKMDQGLVDKIKRTLG